jgi:hypothetical protein
MQKARIPITNFQYGEISPSLVSRTDSPIYNSSAQSVKKILQFITRLLRVLRIFL